MKKRKKKAVFNPGNPFFIILITFLLITTIAILGFQSYKTAEKDTLDSYHQQQGSIARGAGQKVRDFFGEIAGTLKDLAKDPAVERFDPGESRRSAQKSLDRLKSMGIYNIRILDGHGILRLDLASESHHPLDFSWRTYFKTLKTPEFKGTYEIQLIPGEQGEKILVTAVSIQTETGQASRSRTMAGVVLAMADLGSLPRLMLDPMILSGQVRGILINQGYEVIWAPDPSVIGKNFLDGTGSLPMSLQTVRMMGFGQVGETTYGYYKFKEEDGQFFIDDSENLITYTPVPIGSKPWFLGVWAPKREVRQQIRSTYIRLFVLVGLSIIIITGSAFAVLTLSIQSNRKLAQEILSRKKSEASLKQSSKELERANRLKDLFIDIMTHDILSPTMVIKGAARAAKSRSKNCQFLELVLEASERVEEIVRNAHTLSKLKALASIEMQELNLKKVIDTEIDNSRALFYQAGISPENRITPDISVRANPMLHQVFYNILSNAAKYAPGGKRVEVDAVADEAGCTISITDYGPGIPDAYKAELFDRFRRKKKMGVQGSGLGLAIVRRLMELHNGRVWVSDNPKGGSIFHIHLPWVNAATDDCHSGAGR